MHIYINLKLNGSNGLHSTDTAKHVHVGVLTVRLKSVFICPPVILHEVRPVKKKTGTVTELFFCFVFNENMM